MKNTCIPFGFCKLALRRQNEKPGALMQKENEKLSHVENKRPSSSNGGGYSDRGSKRKTKKKKKIPRRKKKGSKKLRNETNSIPPQNLSINICF